MSLDNADVITLIAASIIASQHKLNWNGPESHTISGKNGAHSFRVRFKQANFEARGRRLVWILQPGTVGSGSPPTKGMFLPGYALGKDKIPFHGWDAYSYEEIGGKTVLQWCRSHDTEVVALDVTVDGKRWPVRKTLYWDLLEPNFGRDYVKGSLSKDGRTLSLELWGSDAAGGYQAKWTLRANGKHSRTVEHGD
jgi:hypothetical protein